MANVSLNREAAAVKEIGGWLFMKLIQINAESTKMNKSRASRDIFWGGRSFWSLWDVSEPMRLVTKKKS